MHTTGFLSSRSPVPVDQASRQGAMTEHMAELQLTRDCEHTLGFRLTNDRIKKKSTNCFPKRFVLQSVFPKPIFSKIGDATTDRGKNGFSKVFPNIGYSKTDFCPTSVFPKPIFPKKSANIDQTFANNLPKSADIGQQSTRNLPKSTKIGNQTIKISQNSAKVNWPGWASGVID